MEVDMIATTQLETLPVAVIGAGPVGLAAAAYLIRRGIPVRIYEAGATVAASVREWGHVRTFSPWRYSVDSAARALLDKAGWRAPDPNVLPTGADLYEHYLKPLAALPEMAAVLETGSMVISVTRQGIDKVSSKGRASRPFVLDVSHSRGIRRDLARAVIDASGTWTDQNPLGAGGILADGEAEYAERISYGIPDVLGRNQASFAGRKILVVGAGYSAANILLDLAKLADAEPETSITWVVRGTDLVRVYGGADADQLPARGALGADVKALVDSARVALVTGFATTAVREEAGGLMLEGDTAAGPRRLGPLDRIVAATGQRPDLGLTRELRIELDPWLESARALGPLIDPNVHSCGSVPPHGHRELSHPEPNFYTIGVKSYGRAPTFLLLTGYEQARSVAAAISGDLAAADNVQLVLPETGVCSGPPVEPEAGAGCCGGPPPKGVEACCRADADAKASGEGGCGCASPKVAPARQASCCGAAAA
jgi:thioredoxin reductase